MTANKLLYWYAIVGFFIYMAMIFWEHMTKKPGQCTTDTRGGGGFLIILFWPFLIFVIAVALFSKKKECK